MNQMEKLEDIPWEGKGEMWAELAQVSNLAALTPEERFAYEEALRNYWDLNATYLAKYQAGEAKGRNEGRNERNLEIARSLLSANMPKEFVSQHTGLSLQEIENLGSDNDK